MKKATTYQIDQSGKIEDTAKDSIIAYSNGNKYAISIPRKLKRQIQEIFRLHGFTSLFIYWLFSVGIYHLLTSLNERSEVVVDIEYPGKDKVINSFLLSFLEKNQLPPHNITFARIGNRPPAHYAAKDVFDKKIKPNKTIKIKDIIEALKKTDGRLRECLSTLVDAQPRSIGKRYHSKSKKSRRK